MMEKENIVLTRGTVRELYEIDCIRYFCQPSSKWQLYIFYWDYEEMDETYRSSICQYIDAATVSLFGKETEEIAEIFDSRDNSQCFAELEPNEYFSICWASANEYQVMSSDKKLSAVATDEGVEVHGLLHAIELIFKQGLIDIEKATSMIENYITRIRHYSKERANEIATFMMGRLRTCATSLEEGLRLYEFMQLVSTSITSPANTTSTGR